MRRLARALFGRRQEGLLHMAEKHVKIWYDKEGDYLEVMFERRAGFYRETANPHVMEKVDEKGNVLGFSVMKVSALRDQPLEVAL